MRYVSRSLLSRDEAPVRHHPPRPCSPNRLALRPGRCQPAGSEATGGAAACVRHERPGHPPTRRHLHSYAGPGIGVQVCGSIQGPNCSDVGARSTFPRLMSTPPVGLRREPRAVGSVAVGPARQKFFGGNVNTPSEQAWHKYESQGVHQSVQRKGALSPHGTQQQEPSPAHPARRAPRRQGRGSGRAPRHLPRAWLRARRPWRAADAPPGAADRRAKSRARGTSRHGSWHRVSHGA